LTMSSTAGVTDPGDALGGLIATVPWSRLAHAYDVALDAPTWLGALATGVAAGTPEGLEDFADWLLYSVVHQGTPYSATAPVLWISRRILGDGSRHPALAWCMLAVADSARALRLSVEREGDGSSDEP
jgi:hypothetical protein